MQALMGFELNQLLNRFLALDVLRKWNIGSSIAHWLLR